MMRRSVAGVEGDRSLEFAVGRRYIPIESIQEKGERRVGLTERVVELRAEAKVAAAVKTAYFELERSRSAYHLARQLLTNAPADVRFVSDNSDADSRRARADAIVFRAEIAYREAYAALTSLLTGR